MDIKRTILVVGGAGTLGRAVIEALVKREYRVFLGERNSEKMKNVATMLGSGCVGWEVVDLSNATSVKEFCKRVESSVPNLSGIVNCAAGFYKGSFQGMTEGQLIALLNANYLGPLLLMHGLLALLRQNAPADVVNISSLSSATSLDTSRSSSAHIASKAALQIADEVLGRELASNGIRVTTLAPGTIRKPARDGIPVDMLAKLAIDLIEAPHEIRFETLAIYGDAHRESDGSKLG